MIEKIWNDADYLEARIAMCEAEAALLRERLAEIVGEPPNDGMIKKFCRDECGCHCGDEDDGYPD